MSDISVAYCTQCRLLLATPRRCPTCGGEESVHMLRIPIVGHAKLDSSALAHGEEVERERMRRQWETYD